MRSSSTTAPLRKRRPGGGRKPKDAGGARDKRAGTTLNATELARHRAWLTSQGWPEKAESDIVRDALASQWAAVAATAA